MLSFNKLMQPISLPVDYTKITQAERARVRNQYVKVQYGKCKFCKQPLDGPSGDDRRVTARSFPPGFFTHPIHLHHNHATGMTIGAVHAHCNAVLWQYYGE